jgi:pimeloyl-ACP methyl ester carboxylesterase
MIRPDTHYAKSAGGCVAWQAFGDGPRDILFVANWSSNIDAMWDEPSCSHYFNRLSKIGRVICFDERGTGVSDPVPLNALPTLEEWMDDALAVLDAAGSRQAAVIGDTIGEQNFKFTNNPGNGGGPGGTCSGDSGGPAFFIDPLTGAETSIVMAVNSYGIAPQCNGNDYQFRTDIDAAQDFVLPHLNFEPN